MGEQMIEYRGEVTIKTNGQDGRPSEIITGSGYYDTKIQVKRWFVLERSCLKVGDEIIKEKIEN